MIFTAQGSQVKYFKEFLENLFKIPDVTVRVF